MIKRIGLVLAVVAVLSLPLVWHAIAAVTIDLAVPNAVNVVLYGGEAEDHFGTDLAAGNINGDEFDDLVVGAYLADGPDNKRNGAGEVYVYYGKSAMGWPAVGRPPDITVYGAAAGDLLGGDMFKEPGHIVAGDLDHDGVGDLILGAPEFGHGSTDSLSRGRVWIIWGRSELPDKIDLAEIPPELEVTTVTAVARDFLGAALATGDFDGDGKDDLAMSAPSANSRAGIVYVIFGGSHLRNRDIDLSAVPDDVPIFRAIGAVSGTKLGSYLAFGKLSDDAIDDLVIGSEQIGAYRGTVQVLFGSSQVRGATREFLVEPADWSAIGEADWDQLGRSLATEDINADGQTDLVMGAPTADGPAGPNAGQAIGIFGPLQPGQIRNLAVTPGDLTVYGPQGGGDEALLGESVTIGHFNGDNVGDLLVGARHADGLGRAESGIVYMFYGSSSLEGTRDLQGVSADITLVGANARDFTGYVTTGDVTGDGIDDMITSATDRASLEGEQKAGAVYILFGSQVPPTPIPTMTPTATWTAAPPVTPTATRTVTATPKPSDRLYLPLILRNQIASP